MERAVLSANQPDIYLRFLRGRIAPQKSDRCLRCNADRKSVACTWVNHGKKYVLLCRECARYVRCADEQEAMESRQRIERFRGASAIERRAMVRELRFPDATRLVSAARREQAREAELRSDPVEAAPLDVGSITPARELKRRRRRTGVV
jgi:hypothetical protein